MFDNVDMRADFVKAYNLDGTVMIKAWSPAGATKNTPYAIQVDEYGPVQGSLADNVYAYYVGVPYDTILSAVAGFFQIGGRITALITPTLSVAVGHGLYINDGAIADLGSDYNGLAGQFAVCRTAGTNAETYDCILVPERIIGTT